MKTWATAVDFVIVGSGGGGMVAALTAADAGAETLVLEKQALIGGSTCMSGGIVWIPNNPLMQAEGVLDSYEDAMAHFETVVGDVGRCSSFERRHAYLTAGPEMTTFLQRLGVRFVTCPGYSDYYSNVKGGHDVGRGIEPVPWDGRSLGPWLPKLQPGLAQSLGLAVMTNEARSLSNYNRSLRSFAIAARVVLRTFRAKVRRQALLTNGASLIGQMLAVAVDRGIPVWTEAPLDDLIVEDGRVVGVRTVRDGAPVFVRARQGVLISAGGFAHNREMRQRYGGDQPNEGKWSMSNPGDTGEAIAAAMRLGAQTALMDEAWWLPSPKTGRFGQSTLDQARQRPRTIYVDAGGRRFVNESNSYMEVGKAMYERDKTSRAVPCWLIFDDRYRKRYAHLRSRPGHLPRQLLESGRLKKASTLVDLAGMCGIDVDGLIETVELFNEHAAKGVDPDYGRGESAYNRSLGDPHRKVHPCLGPIDEPPYYACEVLPGDIGTCGGLVTDEHARVLDQHDQPIEGLYATGNSTATVMGRHYLGPGASIANTMVFGYLAARHAAGVQGDQVADELVGRVAIVTGGASGIGRATVERFVDAGARVVIADVDAEVGEAVAAALGEAAVYKQTDVTDADQVQGLVDFTVERFGGLHVMSNNAGVASAMTRFLHDDLSDFDRVVRINVLGVLLGAQRAARHMKAHGGGSIINTSSTAGIDAGAGLITYRATKAAVIHATRSIALDLAQYNIRVNCLVPGQIQTAMTTYDMDSVMKFTQPLPRKGQAEDVAEAAVFLASDRAAQITGVVLPVDGGTTAGPPASQLKLLLGRSATPE